MRTSAADHRAWVPLDAGHRAEALAFLRDLCQAQVDARLERAERKDAPQAQQLPDPSDDDNRTARHDALARALFDAEVAMLRGAMMSSVV